MGLDINGAYDNVWRQALIQTLADKGFPRWIVNMIQSFLSDRTASFHLPGIISDRFDLNTGVPQGSPLSRILFLFFAAPLLQRAKTYTNYSVEVDGKRSKVDLYAFAFVDDIYLMAISDNYAANCKGLEMLHEGVMATADELDLRFGAGKYKIMHFKTRQRKKGHNDVIPDIPDFHEKPVPQIKILGVIVSSDLTWGEHISMIIRKAKQRMGYLSFISGPHWGPNLKTMRLFFISKIRPVFTYACRAWFIRRERDEDKINYQINNKQMNRLENAYTFCLRKISGAFYRTAPQILEKEMFVENIWTVLHSQATLQRAKVLFAPRPLWRSHKSFNFLKSGRAMTSRGNNSAQLPATLTERWGKKSLEYYDESMSRAQTTILLHCRTEFIGLKAHLSKIGIKEAGCGRCACGEFRETPFHLFVQCGRLKGARKKLERIVGHTTYKDLVTKDSKVATQWALKYFDIEQFDSVRLPTYSLTDSILSLFHEREEYQDPRPASPLRSEKYDASLCWAEEMASLTAHSASTVPPFHHEMPGAGSGAHLQPRHHHYPINAQLPGASCITFLFGSYRLDGGCCSYPLRLGSSPWRPEAICWSDCHFEALLEAELSHCVKVEVYFLESPATARPGTRSNPGFGEPFSFLGLDDLENVIPCSFNYVEATFFLESLSAFFDISDVEGKSINVLPLEFVRICRTDELSFQLSFELSFKPSFRCRHLALLLSRLIVSGDGSEAPSYNP
ncbi:hypothetical protein FDENT_950 [Fusarium denticulatum]|uniref:Reverse transcriptase domain-containing protein n=1 Tax=Fusarium denticulatum TaxID=48507 RepID=A0A8H5XJG0_9HYPO|nr:hypothetical protein FDENT_950 [Fusarium denticulatum]